MKKRVIIAKYQYSDQYTSEDRLVGVFDNLVEANKAVEAGCGYVKLYEPEINSYPLKLKEIHG